MTEPVSDLKGLRAGEEAGEGAAAGRQCGCERGAAVSQDGLQVTEGGYGQGLHNKKKQEDSYNLTMLHEVVPFHCLQVYTWCSLYCPSLWITVISTQMELLKGLYVYNYPHLWHYKYIKLIKLRPAESAIIQISCHGKKNCSSKTQR